MKYIETIEVIHPEVITESCHKYRRKPGLPTGSHITTYASNQHEGQTGSFHGKGKLETNIDITQNTTAIVYGLINNGNHVKNY